MDGSVASQSAVFIGKVLDAYVSVQSLPIVVVPAGLLIYAAKGSMDYNKDNGAYHSSIEDKLDISTFKEIVPPLYNAITNNLFNDAFQAVRGLRNPTRRDLLERYEVSKGDLLKTRDFALLEESIDFQEALTKIIESRKNNVEFRKLKETNRMLLIAATITSALSVVSGLAIIFFQKVITIPSASLASAIVLAITFMATFILLSVHWNNKVRIDSLV